MQINRKTRNIAKYLGHLKPSERFLLGLRVDGSIETRLNELGFAIPFVPGHRLLPGAAYGPASRRNAEGFDIIHKDQPMETKFRQVEWRWTQFRGRYDTEEVSKIVDVPYLRYPRTHVPAYSVELEIKMRSDGALFVTTDAFLNEPDNLVVATNTANMLRETLGGFEVLDEKLAGWVSAPVRRMNWQVLPAGKNPWDAAKPVLERLVERAPAGNQSVLWARLLAVGEKRPDFVAVGTGGFDGYSIFGFEAKKLCVLESPKVNNATYILPLESWETLSQMTKAEILDARAHKGRLIHTRSWFNALSDVLCAKPKVA